MDFLGYVRVNVDRSKPLSEVPEVYLDRGVCSVPCSDTLGGLWLMDERFVFKQYREIISVGECV